MPVQEKDKDLFAGFEVDGEGVGVPSQDKDLFAGFEIGGKLVSPTETTTAEKKALSLGAVPGVAFTEDQRQKIAQGEQITPTPRMLDPNINYQPAPPAEGQPFVEAASQGTLNIGGGIATIAGKLVDKLGVDGAEKFLADLEVSQNIEGAETDQVAKDAGVQRFIGEVLGETLSFPVGGGSGSTLVRAIKGFIAGGVPAFLSATGRNEEPIDVAIETAMGSGAGALTEAAMAARAASRARADAAATGADDVTREGIEDAAGNVVEAQKAAAVTGIRTLPAQQTLDPFQLETQAFIGQNPEVSKKAFNVLRTQNAEAAQAVDNLLNIISSPRTAETAGAKARDAATNIIDAAVLARRIKTSPLFKEAFKEGANVNLAPVFSIFDKELKAAVPTGKLAARLKKARGLLAGDKIDAVKGTLLDAKGNAIGGTPSGTTKPSLERLQSAKVELDEMLDAQGDSALGKNSRRIITQAKKALVAQMEEASPGYKNAMDEFRSLSPAIGDLMDGNIGRLADLKSKDLKNASKIIFDAAETNPAIMMSTIATLRGVRGGNEILNGLVRNELERRLGKMKVDLADTAATGGRKLENSPQNLLNNFFGNASQKKILFAALKNLSPTAEKNAKWLEVSLNRASAGRPGGSQTGIRAEISRRLRGVSLAFRDFIRSPIESAVGLGEEAMFSRKVEAIGDALYDPDWMPDMKKIRNLDPNSREAQSQFSALLDKITAVNAAGRTGSQLIATGTRGALSDEETE